MFWLKKQHQNKNPHKDSFPSLWITFSAVSQESFDGLILDLG